MSELLPCPFCAGKAKAKRVGSAFTIYCENLHRFNSFQSKAEAVRQWNARPAPCGEGGPRDARAKTRTILTLECCPFNHARHQFDGGWYNEVSSLYDNCRVFAGYWPGS